MKLFYIANARIPSDKANGIQIAKMGEAFARKMGQNFVLVLPKRDQPQEFKNVTPKDYYCLKNELPIERIGTPFDPLVLDRYIGPIFNGLPYRLQVIAFGISVFIYCSKNRNKGIFYTRDFYLLPFILAAGGRVYYEAHYFPTSNIIIWLHKALIPKLEGVVVITKCFVNYFKEFNYAKILVAPDATDPGFFKIIRRKPNKKIIIGYIGKLSGLGEDKGGNILIRAFDKSFRQNKNIELKIIENKPYELMPNYFNLIDIGVIPFPDRPHFKYFMSPLKLFDYLACGKPIITSDLPAVREILTEENAVFIPPGDSDKLAEAITKLAKDDNLRSIMGQNNLALSKKYTWGKRVEMILKFL